MTIVNLNKIIDTMQPIGGKALLTKYYNHPAIKCTARPTSQQYEDVKLFSDIKAAQKKIVGAAFLEFYVETTMTEWYIYLRRIPIEFVLDAGCKKF